MRTLILLLLCAILVPGLHACLDEDFLEPLSSDLRCHDVCESFEECVDPAYDVAACRSRCQDETGQAETDQLEERLDDCEDCLDTSFCGDGIYPCSGVCAGFVP